MIDQMSNKTLLWLSGTLIGAIVVVSLIWANLKQIMALGVWLKWGLLVLGALLLAYAFYSIWHGMRVKHLDRKKMLAEVKHQETLTWQTEQTTLHQQQIEQERIQSTQTIELERIRLEQMKATLEHERLMMAAQWQSQHVLVPEGHTVVFPTQDGYLPIQSPRVVGQLSSSKQNAQPAGQNQEISYPDPIDFVHVLRSFQPSQQAIYLLNTEQGPVTVPLNKTCHIGLAGTTGGGKTNTLRMFLAQALKCGAVVYMANPNFAPVKINERAVEDWRPIAARLAAPVARKTEDIKKLIMGAVEELDRRRERQQVEVRKEREFFLVLGEWPAIVARWDEAPNEVAKLLREARQYGIYVISEMQDALVKTIGGNSGLRECYRTVYYFGGDATTARSMLDLKGSVDETGLGDRGACFIRSYSTPAVRGRVPFCSNAAVYALLGTPTDGPLPDIDDGTIEGRIVDSTLAQPTMPPLPAKERQTGPLASNARALRQVDEQEEDTFSTRNGSRQDEAETPPYGTSAINSYAQNSGLKSPLETTQGTQESEIRYWLDEKQMAAFCALYQVTGNIDESLKGAGANTAYRQHARLLIVERGLKKKA